MGKSLPVITILLGIYIVLEDAPRAQTSMHHLEHALTQRERSVQEIETVWLWTRDVPADPSAIQRLEQDVKRALDSHPPSERRAVEPGIRRMYARLAYGFRQRARWTVKGFSEGYMFTGELPVIGAENIVVPYRAVLYPTGVLQHEQGLTAIPYAMWILHEPVIALAITGFAPTRWLSDIRLVSESKNGSYVTLYGKFDPPDSPLNPYSTTSPAEFTLDAGKGYALTSVRLERSDGTVLLLQVKRWKRYQDLWLPQEIEVTGGLRNNVQKLSLLEVRPSNKIPPEWLRPGIPVNDVRLGDAGVVYPLPERRLPPLQEIKELAKVSPDRPERLPGQAPSLDAGVWRFLPPIVLVVIGAYWYWRGRQAKQGA